MALEIPSTLRTLRFGHSPDADDAFMFYGFHTGRAQIAGCRVEHVLEDIQTLNRRAIDSGDLEMTAISAHTLPYVAERYAVLACGASFGLGYGPVLVARETIAPHALAGRRVAMPGPLTTASLLMRIEHPRVEQVHVRFDTIPEAVLSGEFDAGVIIHEDQLTYESKGLHKLVDFGELWRTKYQLPVPLGLDVVRRDLGDELMRAARDGFLASIRAAIDDETAAVAYALQFGRGIDTDRGRRFVRMYVNELTLDMGATGRRALEKLYSLAVGAEVLERPPRLEII